MRVVAAEGCAESLAPQVSGDSWQLGQTDNVIRWLDPVPTTPRVERHGKKEKSRKANKSQLLCVFYLHISLLVTVNWVYKGVLSSQAIVRNCILITNPPYLQYVHLHPPDYSKAPSMSITVTLLTGESYLHGFLFARYLFTTYRTTHAQQNSGTQGCWEKVTRISLCISKVHFHSHAALHRGSVGPLWQLCLPAGVGMKQRL